MDPLDSRGNLEGPCKLQSRPQDQWKILHSPTAFSYKTFLFHIYSLIFHKKNFCDLWCFVLYITFDIWFIHSAFYKITYLMSRFTWLLCFYLSNMLHFSILPVPQSKTNVAIHFAYKSNSKSTINLVHHLDPSQG